MESILKNTLENIANGLNDAQKQAVLNPLNSCTKIVAGAGTGKTQIISRRFTKLVLDLKNQGVENPQSKILVITFTDKAAGEMKDRIVKTLESNGIKALGTEDLWISTFHSFCMRILRKYSIEAGLSPSFKMADEKQLKEIYDRLIKRIKYGELLNIDEVSSLNKVSDIDTLLEDIYGVIKKIKSLGISPQEFLEKSVKSTKDFSQNLMNTPFKFETKEDYADSWARHFAPYTDDSLILSEDVFDSIAKPKLILDKNGKRKAIEYSMAQGFPENIPLLEKTELLLTKIIAQIYDLYQKELEKEDIADFDDLINKTIQIFKQNELIKIYYQKYFKHIIVDEFQDTNGAQLELIELLLAPEHADLTYVGDRKQSIYGFRYAQMENLEVLHQNVEKRYTKHFAPINLSINYRSTPEVLNAVNFVTQNELKLQNENLSANPNTTFPDTKKDVKVTVIDDFENAHELQIAQANYIAQEIESLISRDNAEFKDFAVLVKSHSQADIIERELKKKNIPSIKKVNTCFFEESVVKNALSALRLIKNTEDEQALIRLLKVNNSDADIYAMKREFDKNLKEIIEPDELKRLNFAQKFLLLKEGGKVENPLLDSIYETVNYLRKNKNSLTLLQIFEIIKNKLPLYCLKAQTAQTESVSISSNLSILEKIIDDFEQNENYISVNRLIDYLEEIKDDRNFELPSNNTGEVNAVQILTIHASKGLEYPYVFVLSIANMSRNPDKSAIIFDMQYGNKPGFGIIANKFNGKDTPKALIYKQLWKKPREENEALRLFYVAVSRAKKYLNVLSFEPYASVKPVEYIENLANYINV